jgi:hypothetical protein
MELRVQAVLPDNTLISELIDYRELKELLVYLNSNYGITEYKITIVNF